MNLYELTFAVDPVVRFFLSFFNFFFLFEVFLVLVCLVFEGLRFDCFLIFICINVLILFRLWIVLNNV